MAELKMAPFAIRHSSPRTYEVRTVKGLGRNYAWGDYLAKTEPEQKAAA